MKKRSISGMLVALLMSTLLFIPGQRVGAETGSAVFVSLTGNDTTGTGTQEAPFKTIAKARDTVRSRIAGGMSADITVYLREGTYNLNGPVTFSELDSGRNGHEVIYRSYPGEEAVVDGGKIVTGWQPFTANIYRASVGTAWKFDMLFEDGVSGIKARYPNKNGSDNVYQRTAMTVDDANKTKFVFAEGDIPAVASINGLEAFLWPGGALGYQYWYSNILGVSAIDYSSRTVTLSKAAQYVIGAGSRYYMQGALEFLDQPGEFYLDKTEGMLYYWPRSASNLSGRIAGAKAGNVFEFKGSSQSAVVSGIRLEGLIIRDTDLNKSGVYMVNAAGNTVRDCRIYNTGANGVHLYGWAQNNTVTGNDIHDNGHNGICLEGPSYTTQHINTGNVIRNNLVHSVGQQVENCAGIRLMESGENLVSHNRVFDSPRYGIQLKSVIRSYMVGKTYNGILVTDDNFRDFQQTQNNIIEYNDVSACVKDSQDAGIISAWGADIGNVIRYNRVHDSDTPALTADPNQSPVYGIYLDDNTDGTLVEKNIIEHLQTSGTGVLQTAIFAKGVGNTIVNNYIADNNITRGVVHSKEMLGEGNRDITYERNIATHSGSAVFSFSNWADNRFLKSENNLTYSEGQPLFMRNVNGVDIAFDQWRALMNGKYDQLSLSEDPRFMNPAKRDYRLRYDSPAFLLGITDIPQQEIGLESTFLMPDTSEQADRLFLRASGAAADAGFIRMTTGSTQQLLYSARSKTGFVVTPVISANPFYSDNAAVATVSPEGVVTALAPGKATIRLTSSGVNPLTDIRVTQLDVLVGEVPAEAVLNLPVQMVQGQSVRAGTGMKSGLGSLMDLAGAEVTFSSDAPCVVVDASGVVTAVSGGTATVSVTITRDGKAMSAAKQITVTAP